MAANRPWRGMEVLLRGCAGLVLQNFWHTQGDFYITREALYVKPYLLPWFSFLPVPNFRRWYEIRPDNVVSVVTTTYLLLVPYFHFTFREAQEGWADIWMAPLGPKGFLRALRSAGFVVDDRYGVESRSALLMFLTLWWPVLLFAIFLLVYTWVTAFGW